MAIAPGIAALPERVCPISLPRSKLEWRTAQRRARNGLLWIARDALPIG